VAVLCVELSWNPPKCFHLESRRLISTQKPTGLQISRSVIPDDTKPPGCHDGMFPEDVSKPEKETCSEIPSCPDHGGKNVASISPTEDQHSSLEKDALTSSANVFKSEEETENLTSHLDVMKTIIDSSCEDNPSTSNHDGIISQIEEMNVQLPDEVSQIVFDEKSSILKDFTSIITNVKEIQIMKYLNGAGGAPKLLAPTPAFVCENVGNINMLQEMLDINDLDSHFNTMCKVVHRVKEIHAMGISHNNIKPENIVLERETGKVSLIDFSAACQMGESGNYEHDPTHWDLYSWMAPEFKRGDPMTPAGDVYSLGYLLGLILDRCQYSTRDSFFKILVGSAMSEDPLERPSLEEFLILLRYSHKSAFTERCNRNTVTIFNTLKINMKYILAKYVETITFQTEVKKGKAKKCSSAKKE
ncbi:hypothetical protein SK128_025625, partial [Halocaridina rubra]